MSKPAPSGWNKTLDDLFAERKQGERTTGISYDEVCWAKDYERSLLPPNTVFPRAGQLWEVISECDVLVHYVFATAASSSGAGKLASGERVRILKTRNEPKPILVSFLPVRYDDLHVGFVPEDVRHEPLYTGYVLSVKTAYFNQHFKLIEDVA
ncbi:MAG: hypothetical protein ABSD57_12625 [Verrucomicrobiota bacterium]|jgi:hypothetical protein